MRPGDSAVNLVSLSVGVRGSVGQVEEPRGRPSIGEPEPSPSNSPREAWSLGENGTVFQVQDLFECGIEWIELDYIKVEIWELVKNG